MKDEEIQKGWGSTFGGGAGAAAGGGGGMQGGTGAAGLAGNTSYASSSSIYGGSSSYAPFAGSSSSSALGAGFAGAGVGAAGNSKSLSSANAYMLMYRKASATAEERVSLPTDAEVPRYIRDMVAQMEAEAVKKKEQELERRNRIQLRVFHNGGNESATELTESKVCARMCVCERV